MDVLEFLEALAEELRELEASQRAKIEAKVFPLAALLREVQLLVKEFGKPGWFKRVWHASRQVRTLSKIDKDIERLLGSTKALFDLA